MPKSTGEYTTTAKNYDGSFYNQLQYYNADRKGMVGIESSPCENMGYYKVLTCHKPFGYDALSHGMKHLMGNGYFSAQHAYPVNCNTYADVPCNSLRPM